MPLSIPPTIEGTGFFVGDFFERRNWFKLANIRFALQELKRFVANSDALAASKPMTVIILNRFEGTPVDYGLISFEARTLLSLVGNHSCRTEFNSLHNSPRILCSFGDTCYPTIRFVYVRPPCYVNYPPPSSYGFCGRYGSPTPVAVANQSAAYSIAPPQVLDTAPNNEPREVSPLATSPTPQQFGGQKICPVTGQALGSMGPAVPVTLKGQTIYFCCEGCIAKVQSDPDKYIAAVMAERNGG